jgi:hypothetical protein
MYIQNVIGIPEEKRPLGGVLFPSFFLPLSHIQISHFKVLRPVSVNVREDAYEDDKNFIMSYKQTS